MKGIRLSILDQSHIPKNHTAEQAIQYTVSLARLADRLGYTRFWVSEHHNMATVAGTTPEVLLAYLASQTSRMRIGSGGVMLPHYSAFKVAENFRMLELLAPGRIDLGIGRAPGGDRLTASLLNPHNRFSEDDFTEQLYDLQAYLNDSHPSESDHGKVRAFPFTPHVPEMWILSSSGQSGIFAAQFGMAFAFAHFINPVGGPVAVRLYREHFQPSDQLYTPMVMTAIFAFCSESHERIRQVQAIMDYRFLQLEMKGRLDAVSYEDIKDVRYSLAEEQRIAFNRQRFITGTPDDLKEKLSLLAETYEAEEVMVVNAAPEQEDRLSSYELLARAFDLPVRNDLSAS